MTSRLLLSLLAFAGLSTSIFYFPASGSRSAAQITIKPVSTVSAVGVKVDPLLVELFGTSVAGTSVPAVITYNSRPSTAEFSRLQSAGIKKGFALRELPMVIAPLNSAQLAAVQAQPGVRSISANRVMKNFTNESRRFIGVPQMMADPEVTRANPRSPGLPVSGKGVGIGYIDTGIDATHADLKYGTKTVQNVIQPLSETTVGDGGLAVGIGINIFDILYESEGFYAPVYIENQPHSDVESGHGTHGAAVAAGTGVQSGNFYGGMAPGAHLIGVNAGNELGLPLVAILGAYDYLLVNQFQYDIRIINNSWGSSLDDFGIDPSNPINVATRQAHDRNMVVIFAAGNSGDVPNAINPYSTMPWTVSVAAGEKFGAGTPAGFSSRGENNGGNPDVTTQPADPNARPNLRPDITAPGVDIKSARMKGVGLTNTAGTLPIFVGSNDLETIPPAYLPFYTTSQGTSFACPHVSGVVALMLEANPVLTPAEVITILRKTARRMPYEERVVGAGYVDAHYAVREALGLGQVPHPPDAVDDSATTEENKPVTINVLANDTDANGEPLSVTGVTQGAHGTVVNNGGAVTYLPNTSFSGDDLFTYTASDPGGRTDKATVRVVVESVCPKVPTGGFADTLEPGARPGWSVDTAQNKFGNAVSPNWQVITDFNAHSPSHSWFSDAKTLDLKDDRLVLPVLTPSESTRLTFWHRFEFEDGYDGGVLEVSADGGTTWGDVGESAFAEGGYNGSIDPSFGNPIAGRRAWTGGPAANAAGVMTKVVVNLGGHAGKRIRLRFRLGTDQLLAGSLPGGGWWIDDVEVNNTLEVSACNKPPIAVDDSAGTLERTPVTINVLANDTDPEGGELAVSAVGQPAHGTATSEGGGAISYTPVAGFIGDDTFTYQVSDAQGNASTASVTVHVSERPNTAPEAADDSAATQEGTAVVINLTGNDTDPDGDTLTVASVSAAANGTVFNNGDGTATYVPAAGFVGADSFTYTVSDGRGGADDAQVLVTVTRAPNAPPEAADDAAVTQEGTAINISVLANDTDPNNDVLTLTAATQPANGQVVKNADNTVTYAPNAGFAGTDHFTYTVSDGRGGSDTAAVVVIVERLQSAEEGKASGQGAINDGGALNFHFNAKSNDGAANGRFNCDGLLELRGTIQMMRISGHTAEIAGVGSLADGRPVSFKVYVEDNMDGGTGYDLFSLEVFDSTGNSVRKIRGLLEKGNIQVLGGKS